MTCNFQKQLKLHDQNKKGVKENIHPYSRSVESQSIKKTEERGGAGNSSKKRNNFCGRAASGRDRGEK